MQTLNENSEIIVNPSLEDNKQEEKGGPDMNIDYSNSSPSINLGNLKSADYEEKEDEGIEKNDQTADEVEQLLKKEAEQMLNEDNSEHLWDEHNVHSTYFLSIFGLEFSSSVHFFIYLFMLLLTFGLSYKILTHDPTKFSYEDNGEHKKINLEIEKMKAEIETQRIEAEKWFKISKEAKESFNEYKKTLEKMIGDKEVHDKMNKEAEEEMELNKRECLHLEEKIKRFNEELKAQQERVEHFADLEKNFDKKKEELEKEVKKYESEIAESVGIAHKVEKELKEVEKQLGDMDGKERERQVEKEKLHKDVMEKKKEIEISNKLVEMFSTYDKEFTALKESNDDEGITRLMQKIADDFSSVKTEDAIKEMQQEIDAMKKALELEKDKGEVYKTELRKLKLEEENLNATSKKWEADIERIVADRRMLEKLVEEKEKEYARAKDEEEIRKKEQIRKEKETKELEELKTTYMKDIEDLKNEIKEMGIQHRQKIAVIDKKTHEYWQLCLKSEKEIAQSKADIAYYRLKIAEMEKKYDEARSAREELTIATSPIPRRSPRPADLRFPPPLPRLPPPPFLPPPHLMFPRIPAPPFEWDEYNQQRQQPRNKERDN